MKVLVVGGGGREHVIVWKLKQSARVTEVLCAPGNGGIAQLARCVSVDVLDIQGMVSLAQREHVDLVMVAPDDPLAAGMVDAMESAGIRVFGPRANAAILEASKAFSKDLMKKYNIPTAGYEVFTDSETASSWLKTQKMPIVLKADGLALGKGVLICMSLEEALAGVKEIMEDQKFGKAGNRMVVEQFMTGPEVSVLAFTDGKTLKPMVSAQDHKRAKDNDEGLNTGGMGTFAPSRLYTPEIADWCMEHIYLPTIAAMNTEGRPFKGVLYFGLMLTPDGPRVVEYNARFGDPEAQVVLPLLETDLLDVFEAIIDERLDQLDIRWKNGAAVCVILASGGYPESYAKGFPISGLEEAAADPDVTVFHAGTKCMDDTLVTNGGRVLGVTAVGLDMDDARAHAYAAAVKVQFQDVHYRRDIGIKK